MPLVAIALAAYVAGLVAGFAGSAVLAAMASISALMIGTRRGRAVACALAALALTGWGVAASSRGEEDACVRRAPALAVVSLTLQLNDSAGPGSYARASLPSCRVMVWLSVEHGEADAGSMVSARGVAIVSQRGLMVQHATIEVVRPPNRLSRLRSAAGRAIDQTFGSDAPLVRALLIADKQALSPEIRDAFAAAGLAHILAIAGLHIGIIAMTLAMLIEVLGGSRQRAAAASVVLVIAYVAVIGAPVPAVRSAMMLTTLMASRLMQRPTSRWAIVALGASQPVIDPAVVLDVGYQLSVVGVAAMIAGGQVCKRAGVDRRPALERMVITTCVTTTVATIATAPIVAWVFGRVSLIAPLSNVAAAPLIALAQPLLLCALLLSPIHGIASFLADAAHPLLAGLMSVATVSASVPNASVSVAPTLVAAIVGGVMSVGVIVACIARDWMRPGLTAMSAGIVLSWLPLTPRAEGMVELHMIDVGQGDAIALRTAHGHWVLFDAGGAWRGGDAGRSTILPYLGRHDARGTIDAFVLSHPHTDHVGGASTVLRVLRPGQYVDGGFPGPAGAYRASLEAARAAHVRWTRAHPGDRLALDGVSLTFLAPDSTWTSGLVDPNLASVVTLVRVGDVRMLLMGDAERAEEEWLLAHERDALRADILKVGHHGSTTSSSGEFLDAVRPRVALVSVGAGNSYHLPSPVIMRALAAQGAHVLRTDRLGTVVARTDGRRVIVEAAGDVWELPKR